MNLVGVHHSEIARGQELSAPGYLRPSRVMTARIHLLPDARPLKNRSLVRLHVDPLEGFHAWQARRLVYGAGVTDPAEQKQVAAIVGKLYDAFVRFDAMLCEINPLIVKKEGEGVVAVDGLIVQR